MKKKPLRRRPSLASLAKILHDRLSGISPDITSQVTMVHKSKWWAVYVFAPKKMEEEDFMYIVRKTRKILRDVWLTKPGIPRNSAGIGRDDQGQHFCVHWLPILPRRSYKDFKRFYHFTGRSSF